MSMQTLAMFALVAFAVGGVIWVFVYPLLSGERHAELRQQSVIRTDPAAARAAATSRAGPKVRREQVEESLKELELRQKKLKNVPLQLRISQAGLTWSKRQFIIVSAVVGLVLFVAGFVMSGSAPDRRRHGFRRRLRPSALAAVVPEEAARKQVPLQFSRRGRRHRARRQGRPAARRLPAHHRERGAGAGARRVQDHRGIAADRHPDGRSVPEAL